MQVQIIENPIDAMDNQVKNKDQTNVVNSGRSLEDCHFEDLVRCLSMRSIIGLDTKEQTSRKLAKCR